MSRYPLRLVCRVCGDIAAFEDSDAVGESDWGTVYGFGQLKQDDQGNYYAKHRAYCPDHGPEDET